MNTWEMFVEINSKTFSEESVQFDNLHFKNNIKVHPNSKYFYPIKLLNFNIFYCNKVIS